MTLMDRIKVTAWTLLGYEEKEKRISSLQLLRISDQREQALKKIKVKSTTTKSAKRNRMKTSLTKTTIPNLLKSLLKLSPSEQAKILSKYKGV